MCSLEPALCSRGLPNPRKRCAVSSFGLETCITENSAVEQVHYRYRRCWRHHGHTSLPPRRAALLWGPCLRLRLRSPARLVLRRSPALGSPALAALVNNTSEAGLAGLIRIAACCDTAAPLYSSTSRCRSLLRGTQTARDKALHTSSRVLGISMARLGASDGCKLRRCNWHGSDRRCLCAAAWPGHYSDDLLQEAIETPR